VRAKRKGGSNDNSWERKRLQADCWSFQQNIKTLSWWGHKNIGKLFKDIDTATMIDYIAEICSVLSEGYENSKKYEEPGYVPDILSADEVMTLGIDEISELQDEMMTTIEKDMGTTIKTEPVKSGKKTGKK
jgi:hypothetical protein